MFFKAVSLAFDVEEIRDKAKSIPDLNERLSYLNTKLTDYKLYDGLDRDEEEWLGGPVFQALQALIEEAKNEQQIEEKKARSKAHAQPEQNPTPPRTWAFWPKTEAPEACCARRSHFCIWVSVSV